LSRRKGDTIKQFIDILLLDLTFLPIRFSSFYFLPIRVSTFDFCPFDFRASILAHSSFTFLKNFWKKVQKIFWNDNVMHVHYDKQKCKICRCDKGDDKLFGHHDFLKMSMSWMHTTTKKHVKLSRHKGDTIKSVYSYSIIRFHFSAHSSFEYHFSAHSSFEHLFLPIRFSTFYFCPFDFQIFKNPFIVKNFFVSKMQCSCTPTRTNKNVKFLDATRDDKIVENVNVMHAHSGEQNMEKVNTSRETQ
jgi:hypothetical protein